MDIQTIGECKCGKCYGFKMIYIQGRYKGVLYCNSCEAGEILFTAAEKQHCILCDKEYPETDLIKGYCPVCMGGMNTEKVILRRDEL